MTMDSEDRQPSRRRIAGQGMLLFTGFGAAQALSFVRNALIGHALSKGDFGIAAAITILLQMVETLSDLGSDRMIMQARDGDTSRFLAASHLLLAIRGAALATILFIIAPLAAAAFGAAHAATAFQIATIVPLIKGFMHLDFRVAQRNFDNRPQLLVDIIPQAMALLATWPLLQATQDYTIVVALSCAQALVVTVLSHILAQRPYQLGYDRDILIRQLRFGWPILAGALPLMAVYQGDRVIIAHYAGVEALASYTAAFMVTMVPALIAAKVGHALMLPLFSNNVRRGQVLQSKFRVASESTIAMAALYLAGFIICGGVALPIVFGAQYTDLGPVVSWLAAMWALRMIQSAPGMAIMAHGETTPFLIAGVIRAAALPVIVYAAANDASLSLLAAIGCAFEALSLIYITLRLNAVEPGLGGILASRTAFIAPAVLLALVSAAASPPATLPLIATAVAAIALLGASAVAVMPSLNALTRRAVRSRIPATAA